MTFLRFSNIEKNGMQTAPSNSGEVLAGVVLLQKTLLLISVTGNRLIANIIHEAVSSQDWMAGQAISPPAMAEENETSCAHAISPV